MKRAIFDLIPQDRVGLMLCANYVIFYHLSFHNVERKVGLVPESHTHQRRRSLVSRKQILNQRRKILNHLFFLIRSKNISRFKMVPYFSF